MPSNESPPTPDWGTPSSLSPEQIISWLDGYRQLMFEVWRNDPKLYATWVRLRAEEYK